MNNKRYLLIIYLNELNLWLKTGIKKVTKSKLVSATLSKKGIYSSINKVGEKLIKNLPDYDDDFEILIVEIPVERLSKLKKKSTEYMLPFEWISKVYPITSRGKKLLNGKLDDRIIVQEPIFENQFLPIAKEREKELGRRGAESILKIFELDGYITQFNPKSDLVDEALRLRESNSEKISAERQFMTNLVLYDRNKPFPNNDLGYFYDIGTLLKVYENNDESKRKNLREFADTLERFKTSSEYRKLESMILELHNASMIVNLEKIINENVLVSSLIYLYLRNNIREGNDLEKSGLIEIYNNEFLSLNFEEELALAFWLVGYFFGFEMVADLYYKKIKPETLNFQSSFPELKKKIILNEAKPSSQENEVKEQTQQAIKSESKVKKTRIKKI
ncbi:MAG: hypothetical protein IPM14_05190 [bacterium]|nr:hypothetical protein [bacterium]